MGLDVNSEFGHSEFLLVPDVTFRGFKRKDFNPMALIGSVYERG